MRRWTMLWALAMTVTLGAGAAHACYSCSDGLQCIKGHAGQLCVGDGGVCAMIGRCGWPLFLPERGEGTLQLTLLAAPAGATARLERDAGEVVVAERAAELAGVSASQVLWSGVGYDDLPAVAFRAPRGDGFTLERRPEGRGAWLTVRELEGRRGHRVLACERLDENDALIVPVTLDGRACLLVVASATLPDAEAGTRVEHANAAVSAAHSRALVRAARMPFELEALEP